MIRENITSSGTKLNYIFPIIGYRERQLQPDIYSLINVGAVNRDEFRASLGLLVQSAA